MTTTKRRARGAWLLLTTCCAMANAVGCITPAEPIALVEGDAGSLRDAPVTPRTPDAARGDAGEACDVGCVVDGICHPDGARNEANPCEVCDIARSTTSFVSDEGASCDDGAFCTIGDVCVASACVGVPRACDDGAACTAGDTCDETLDACVSGPSSCTGDQVCELATGACVSTCDGCSIDDVCLAAGDVHPTEPCAVCDPAQSRDQWSVNDGARCDDGLFCTLGDVCVGKVCTGSAPRDCDDGIECTGVERCSDEESRCLPGEPTCPEASSCSTMLAACVWDCAGCTVDGVCVAEGDVSPDNACMICDPSRDRFAFSAHDGASCDDGEACTSGDICFMGVCRAKPLECDDGIGCNGVEACQPETGECVAGVAPCGEGELCDEDTNACTPICTGCTIDGVCHADGASRPSNPCERCDVSTSSTSWSSDDGAGCDDGSACTVDVCRGGVCEGTPVVCDDGIVCNGEEHCAPESGVCVAGTSTCADGSSCDVATDVCICDGCLIDGACVALGAARPGSPCEVCAAAGDDAWSALEDGASCDDGVSCTVDACVAGVCVGVDSCTDGATCDGTACVPPE